MTENIDQITKNAIVAANNGGELSTTTTGQVSFLTGLPAERQAEIRSSTPALVDKFISSQTALLDYGQDSVVGVNNVVNKLLDQQGKMRIPDLDALLLDTNRELQGFVNKNKNIKAADLQDKPNLLQRIFRRGKSELEQFRFEQQTVTQKLENMELKIVQEEDALARNIVSSQMLLEENNNSVEKLVDTIARLEAAQEDSAERADGLRLEIAMLDATSPEYHKKSDELARVSEVVNTLEQQHTEYMGRLYVAWSTAPQMRNLIKTSSDMSQKMGMLRRNTIPTMKQAIAELGAMQTAMRTGNTIDAIVNANNQALQMLAATSKDAIPAMQRAAQSPTIRIETVEAIAQSIVAQNEGIVAAIEAGRQQRAQLESKMIESAENINESSRLRDAMLVEELLNTAPEERKVKDVTDSTTVSDFKDGLSDLDNDQTIVQ